MTWTMRMNINMAEEISETERKRREKIAAAMRERWAKTDRAALAESETEKQRREKISKSSKERWQDPEYRERTSAAISDGLLAVSDKLSENGKQMWKKEGHREKVTAAQREKWAEPEFREGVIASHVKRWADNPEMKERYSKMLTERWKDNDEERQRYAKMSSERQSTPEAILWRSEKMKEIWSDPEYKDERVRNLVRIMGHKHPNGFEQKYLDAMEAEFPGQWRFTGAGNNSHVVGGKCPDFVHVSDKKIIELFGIFWHERSEESQRIEHFRQFGYETLVIWEDEKMDEAMQRIRGFANS